MSDPTAYVVLAFGTIIAFGMLFSVGGNDVANSIGVATGSGALTPSEAAAIAAVMNVIGSLLSGTKVTTNVASKIAPMLAEDTTSLINALAFISALVASIFVIMTGTLLALPLSCTHTIIGAVIGVGAVVHGVHAVDWSFVKTIVTAWFTSPLLGALLTLSIRLLLVLAARSPTHYTIIVPFVAGGAAASAFAVPALVGPRPVREFLASTSWALRAELLIIFSIVAALAYVNVRQRLLSKADFMSEADIETLSIAKTSEITTNEGEDHVGSDKYAASSARPLNQHQPVYGSTSASAKTSSVENDTASLFVMNENAPIFHHMLLFSVPAIAFAHGSNDVSNGVGPYFGIVRYFLDTKFPMVTAQSTVTSSTNDEEILIVPLGIFILVLLFGGIALACGITILGHKVRCTIGRGGIRRARWTYAQGFAAQSSAAAAILTASAVGIPVSTSHSTVGAVMGCAINLPPSWFKVGNDNELCDAQKPWRPLHGFNWPKVKDIGIGAILTPIVSGSVAALFITIIRIVFIR